MSGRRFGFVFTAALFSAGFVGAASLELQQAPQGALFGDQRFSVRFDPQTGWPGEVLCDGQTVVQAADTKQCFDLKQNEEWVTGRRAQIQSLGVEQLSPDTAKSRMRVGEWAVDAMVQLFPEERMLRRWFEITWNGEQPTKIKAFWFQDGVLLLNGGGSYFFPATYPPRKILADQLVKNRKTSNGRSPCPVIGDTGNGWSVLWVANELAPYADRGGVGVSEAVNSIRVTRSFNMMGYMRKGITQQVGDSWLWVVPSDGETLLQRMPEWFRKVGQLPPADRPAWLKRVVLYSFHPGGTIGSQCKDLGGFKPATELLPLIRNLGCNAIWLLPLEDKSIYWPRDYYKLQEGLGTPEDYKALTARAHSLGMRVWQDCVPHGGCNEFPRAKEHPEWLVQNEDGSTLYYWCFDFNWPSWIQYMSDVVSFYTGEYGLDGFRIDACGGSKIPNWNPDIPYARASLSQAQGGFAMQRALRKAVKAIRPDGANLAEVGSSVYGVVSDSIYDFSLCSQVLHDFRKSPTAEFVPRLQRWLHEQQYSEVPDLVRMRYLESHDSLRSALWYGAAPQRALLALISWIHGIPMVYHEMEEGNTGYFRRIFHVRHYVAELNTGKADYLGVQAPEGVFACLRSGGLPLPGSPEWSEDYSWDTRPRSAERASIVLVNLNGVPVEGDIRVASDILPLSLQKSEWVRNLMTGKKLDLQDGSVSVTLSPFGYTVLRFESRELPALKPLETAQNKVDLTAPTKSFVVKCGSGKLLFDAENGMPDIWKSGWLHAVPLKMDLAVPETLTALGTPGKFSQIMNRGAFKTVREFGGSPLEMRYEKAGNAVRVHACWKGDAPTGAALVFDLPAAESWSATSAEGRFASPFRVRHLKSDGLEREGTRIKISFRGELRGFCRFDKMVRPIKFYTEYTFDGGPDFGFACAVKPEAMPSEPMAFLSMMLRTCGTTHARFLDDNGLLLEGNRPAGRGRYVQTARSKEPGRMPSAVHLSSGNGDILYIGNTEWFGSLPANVFMDAEDLYFAWMDGQTGSGTVGKWNGMRTSIGFDKELSPVEDKCAIRFFEEEPVLLWDGGFEQSSAETLRLLFSGDHLPAIIGGKEAWFLPEDAARVNEDDRRCMRISGNGADYRLIRQSLPSKAFKPGSEWRLNHPCLSVRVHLKAGDVAMFVLAVNPAVGENDMRPG